LNILTGNVEPDAGSLQVTAMTTPLAFTFPRTRWDAFRSPFRPEHLARSGVGRTWQDVRLFLSLDLADNIAVAARDNLGERPIENFVRPGAARRRERAVTTESHGAIGALGLAGRELSSADRVSLGQAKRIAIARAIHSGARIILLDEPLAGLDAAGVRDVLEHLRTLAQKRDHAFVIVEHTFNIKHVLDLASVVWTLTDGTMQVEDACRVQESGLETGDVRTWLRQLLGPHVGFKSDALPGGAELLKFDPTPSAPDRPAIEVEDLVVYRSRRMVVGGDRPDHTIDGVSFAVRCGQLAVLCAPNGWGKTTLLEALGGLAPIQRGAVRIHGRPLAETAWERRAQGVSLLRSRDQLFPNLTVRDNISALRAGTVPTGLSPLFGRRVLDLSGGERQALALACLRRGPGGVLLLDEPFSALDPEHLKDCWNSIQPHDDSASILALPADLKGD
jgi:ABC-type branched-subunit amino acid transport system ATPase component